MPSGEYLRYVALGDSQTEGLGDGDDVTGLRGWADRLAEQLAAGGSGLQYANLAVRGHLAAQIHAEQLGPALALRPDLATVVAGVNDLLRPRFDADEVAGHLEAMFAALTAQGACVATLTFPTSRGSPRLPGRSDLARSPSTTAFAPRPSATGSSSPKPPTTRSSPTHGCGARTGSTPVPSGTNGSPPPSPTRCDCPAAATPGPTPCLRRRSPLRMAHRGRRTALGRHLPRPLARQAPARPLLRRRPHGQTPEPPSPPGAPRGKRTGPTRRMPCQQ